MLNIIKFFYFALNAVLLFVQTQPRYGFKDGENTVCKHTWLLVYLPAFFSFWYILNIKSATFKLLAMDNVYNKVAYFALNTVLLFHGHNIITRIAFQ